MPFTFSHPLAVLPLLHHGRARGRLVASALVCGAMAPDLPYFAGEFAAGRITHAWWGVPTVDVAVTALLVALWHLLLRAPLVALLPARWAGAAELLTAPQPGSLRWPRPADAARFALSAAIGAATHVGWDGFTHPGRFGVRLLPALQTVSVLGRPLYAVLQYGTSAIALAVLARWLLRELRRAADAGGRPCAVTLDRRSRRTALAGTAAAAVAGAGYTITFWYRPGEPLSDLVPTSAFGSVAGAGAALLLHAAVSAARTRAKARRA
ncbi:DUF4184 family protein [Kitasatospora sp. NPDC059571]|uniref:DUF4184 family protein n=1 Tax=Kitasatospora sp. NPDC059571 TaxID=3346871 RepID=UPI00368D2285